MRLPMYTCISIQMCIMIYCWCVFSSLLIDSCHHQLVRYENNTISSPFISVMILNAIIVIGTRPPSSSSCYPSLPPALPLQRGANHCSGELPAAFFFSSVLIFLLSFLCTGTDLRACLFVFLKTWLVPHAVFPLFMERFPCKGIVSLCRYYYSFYVTLLPLRM